MRATASQTARRSEEHPSELPSLVDHRDLHSFPTRRSSDLDDDRAAHGGGGGPRADDGIRPRAQCARRHRRPLGDRKSTRLNSRHSSTTEIYTLSLHDALPISTMIELRTAAAAAHALMTEFGRALNARDGIADRS